MPRRTRQEVYAHAVQVAREKFADAGYEATSIQVIADKMGMSKQALMHHFPVKEKLRDAVYEDLGAHFDAALVTLAEAIASGHPIDAIDGFTQSFERERHLARFFLRELLDNPEIAFAWLRIRSEPFLELTDSTRREGGDIDPPAHAAAMAALMLTNATFLADMESQWRDRVSAATSRLLRRGSTALESNIDRKSEAKQ